MKKLFLSILFVSCFIAVHGQERHTLDSLKNLLARAKPDTNKVLLYVALSDQYVWSYPDSCLLFVEPGIRLADKLDFYKGKYFLKHYRGYALALRGNFPQALKAIIENLKLADSIGNADGRAAALRQIGDIYQDAHDYASALKYFRAFKINATSAFYNQWRWLSDNGIGAIYFEENKLDSALTYELSSYNSTGGRWPPASIALSKTYEKLGDYKKATFFSLHAVQTSYYKGDQALANNILADVYRHTGKIDSAIYYAKKGLAISLAAYTYQHVPNAAGLLSDLFKIKHLPDSALKYEDIMVAVKDSLFSRDKVTQVENIAFNEQERQQAATEKETQFRNRVKTAGLLLIIAATLAIAFILWRNSKQKQKANLLLNEQKEEIAAQRDNLEETLGELRSTQTQLIQREKMASLGELTAGIAHEIQNPLNFVNNFSEVNREMLAELQLELDKGDIKEAKAIAAGLEQNEQKISHHGKRADFIVKGMLEHSRKSTGEKQPTNMNVLCDEFLKLSYHGLRAKDKSFNAEMVTHFAPDLSKINVSQQDMGRVMLNLFNNAFYAVHQKAKTAGADYKPTIEVTTKVSDDKVIISVRDNGPGIPENIKDKIMQPFFTTKPTGEGTGLGLSLSYDIVVKGHNGNIEMDTKEREYTIFTIKLPIS